jgi:hypothetical protein
MFMIQVLAYILIAGQSPEAPVMFQHKLSFNGLDKCQAYLKSDQFQVQRQQLAMMLKVAATPRATEDVDQADGAVEPAVTVTASCVEDNRL